MVLHLSIGAAIAPFTPKIAYKFSPSSNQGRMIAVYCELLSVSLLTGKKTGKVRYFSLQQARAAPKSRGLGLFFPKFPYSTDQRIL
jgi:hypothetical protein